MHHCHTHAHTYIHLLVLQGQGSTASMTDAVALVTAWVSLCGFSAAGYGSNHQDISKEVGCQCHVKGGAECAGGGGRGRPCVRHGGHLATQPCPSQRTLETVLQALTGQAALPAPRAPQYSGIIYGLCNGIGSICASASIYATGQARRSGGGGGGLDRAGLLTWRQPHGGATS